jgi:hypothetical protein
MAQEAGGRAAPNSPKSAARLVRRSAQAIRARTAGLSQHRAEREALIEWARLGDRLLPFSFIERFSPLGDGAEHRVYKDQNSGLAIKATHTNRFGYSTEREGEWATPVEYLKRLAWQNFFFGDEIRIVGIAFDDEGQIEIVTSQPWVSAHPVRPNPVKEEINAYMGKFGFVSTSRDLDTPIYYCRGFGLIAIDAHDRNVIRDTAGNLVAIDLIIGPPSPERQRIIGEFLSGPPPSY